MTDLSEAKQIEFDRRRDVMCAVIPVAISLHIDRKSQLDLRDEKTSLTTSKWLWGIFILGLIINWVLTGSMNASRDVGTLISVFCIMIYIGATVEIYRISGRLSDIDKEFRGLAVQWSAATGRNDLRDVRKFIHNEFFDDEDEEYLKWLREAIQHVLDEIRKIPFSQRTVTETCP